MLRAARILKISLSVAVFLISIGATTGAAQSNTYFVAPDGNDRKGCTAQKPCRTIKAGISKLAAGDTLVVKAGVYNERFDCQGCGDPCIPAGKNWDSPTRIVADPPGSVTLKPDETVGACGLMINFLDNSYVEVSGFVFDGKNLTNTVIKISQGAHHIRIKDCEIKNGPMNGILISHSGTASDPRSDFNEIINCRIHDNGFTSGSGHQIYVSTSNNLIDGCEIFSGNRYGIHLWDKGDNNIIRNNICYKTDRSGIGVFCGSNQLVYNNVSFENREFGIYVRNDNGSLVDPRIYNNTVYSNRDGGILIDSLQAGSAFIKNNIAWLNGGSPQIDSNVSAVLENNLVGIDPLFVNPAGHDFRLQGRSPAIDSGEPLDDVIKDRDGTARPKGQGYDAGAYEYDRSGLSVQVNAPRGGQSVRIGDRLKIKWQSNFPGDVKIELSRDNGGSWETLIDARPGDKGILKWKVTGPATTQALIRISSVGDPQIAATSTSPFVISPSLTSSMSQDAGAPEAAGNLSTPGRTSNQQAWMVGAGAGATVLVATLVAFALRNRQVARQPGSAGSK